MNRNPVIAIVAIVIIALSALGTGYFASPSSTVSGQTESISIGTAPVELAALVYIADDRGFFYGNGLNATIKNYDSALSAVAGMERGEVDISLSTEYPIVEEVFGSANISVFGSIDKYQTTYIVGMKDRGIQNSSDVAGKKIGVTRRSVGEFYLGRFLNLHGMNLGDVTLADLKPAQVQDALADRSIDAAVIWNIDPERVREQFGDNAVIWASQGGQPTFGVVAGRNDRIANRSVAIPRFLRSIDEAERYAVSHPAEARAIVQRRVNASDAHMEAAWSRHQFTLTLDQSLITAMEGEARWMIANNMTEEKTIPDFRKCIDTGSLEEIKPGSVRIIG
jgi:NitT/TauT family transport system substrate-binding protein